MNYLTSIIVAPPHGAAAIYDNGLIAVDPCYLQSHGLDLSSHYIGAARQLVQDGILYLDNGGDGQSRLAPIGCDSGVVCFIPLHLLPAALQDFVRQVAGPLPATDENTVLAKVRDIEANRTLRAALRAACTAAGCVGRTTIHPAYGTAEPLIIETDAWSASLADGQWSVREWIKDRRPASNEALAAVIASWSGVQETIHI